MIYNVLTSLDIPEQLKDSCATFGVFDGVHDGHVFEIQECVSEAKSLNKQSFVLTFDIDPDEIFVKDFIKLMSNEERIEMLSKSQIDNVIVFNFKNIKDLTGDEFLNKFLVPNTPLSLHIGQGFKFGKKQSGNTDLLLK